MSRAFATVRGDESRGASFVPAGTCPVTFQPTHRWKRWAIIGRPYGNSAAGTVTNVPEAAKIQKSGWSFIMEDIGDQLLMSRDCPELSRQTEGEKETKGEPRKQVGGIGIPESAVCGLPDGMGILKGWGDALTGLRNLWGGLPRASLADSLCPGLTSGCAFGARKGSVPTGMVGAWNEDAGKPPASSNRRRRWG